MKTMTAVVVGLAVAAGVAQAAGIEIEPVHVTVVDAQTGAPITGAVVTESIPVFVEAGRNVHEGVSWKQSGDLHIAEAVTDSNGKARVEGASEKPLPAKAMLRDDVPWLYVYKQGYRPSLLVEPARSESHKGVIPPPPRIASDWNGKTIRLQPEPDSGLTQLELKQMDVFIAGVAILSETCRWQQMPQLINELQTASTSRPSLAARLEHRFNNPRSLSCEKTRPPVAWKQAGGGALELHVDVAALLAAGREAQTPPSPDAGSVTVVVAAAGEQAGQGVLFFTLGESETRELRYNGQRATLGPLQASKGESIRVSYLPVNAGDIRRGAIEIGN